MEFSLQNYVVSVETSGAKKKKCLKKNYLKANFFATHKL